MNRLKRDFQSILNNERGVALIMIMTAIILLMAIYGQFTFESKISRIKATNIMDRSQAKLLAESGVQLAMARLRLYKEAYNKVQSNPNAKKAVPTQLLNQLWEVPFIFPIPTLPNSTMAFKETVEKFQKTTLLDGEMKITIQNISNRLNLNMLRVDMVQYSLKDPSEREDRGTAINLSDTAIQTEPSVDQALYFMLKRQVDEKKEKDEEFEDRYGNLNYQELITNLKFFMSDFQGLSQDPMAGEAESNFQRIPLTPKFGPMGSVSELFSIPGWSDELIELIQNEFSVYPNAQIDLNKLTANMLKILIPNITEDEVKEFFLYRDDPENPKFLNTIEDFKKYIVDEARLMGSDDFDKRMKSFEEKGISFGSNPNLFRVVSEGKFNRSLYTLVAYVVLPKQEVVKPKTTAGTASGAASGDAGGTSGTTAGTSAGTTGGSTTGGAANQNTQLLEPRIIEIQVN